LQFVESVRTAEALLGRRCERTTAMVCVAPRRSASVFVSGVIGSRKSKNFFPMVEARRSIRPAALSAPKEASKGPAANSRPTPQAVRQPLATYSWNSLITVSATEVRPCGAARFLRQFSRNRTQKTGPSGSGAGRAHLHEDPSTGASPIDICAASRRFQRLPTTCVVCRGSLLPLGTAAVLLRRRFLSQVLC
jgi:hypothetical protein